jgi:hypothetical protein
LFTGTGIHSHVEIAGFFRLPAGRRSVCSSDCGAAADWGPDLVAQDHDGCGIADEVNL